jgi:hypothetical protein
MISTLNFFGKSPQKISNGVNRCSVLVRTLHSSVFARLASGAFYETIIWVPFSEIINFHFSMNFTVFPKR